MRTESVNVKSKGKIVATTEWERCDTLDEAVATHGEATVLADTNKRIRTNAMNVARQKAVGVPSLKAHRIAAMSGLTTDELQACVGNGEALEAMVARKAREIAAAEEGSTPDEAEVSDEGDEDDD